MKRKTYTQWVNEYRKTHPISDRFWSNPMIVKHFDIDKSQFVESEYARLLKKSGKTITPAQEIERGLQGQIKRIVKTRPEYASTFKNPV